jgi:hypothetical protein
MQVDLPPLAQYKSRKEYSPEYGDYVVWSGWITTWHGVVTNFDANAQELSLVWAGVPFLLFTMDEETQKRETKKLKLDDLRNAGNGKFAIQRLDKTHNVVIWYI